MTLSRLTMAVAAWLLTLTTALPAAQQLLQDPEFQQGFGVWRNISAIPTNDDGTPRLVMADGKMQIMNQTPVGNGRVRFVQDVQMQPGQLYQLSFRVDAPSDTAFFMTVQLGEGKWLYHSLMRLTKGSNFPAIRFRMPFGAANTKVEVLFQTGGTARGSAFSQMALLPVDFQECAELQFPKNVRVRFLPGNEWQDVPFANGVLELKDYMGKIPSGEAEVIAEFQAPQAGNAFLGFAADWFFQVKWNDREIVDAYLSGHNGDTQDLLMRSRFLPVQQGKNTLHLRLKAGSKGWQFRCGVPPKPKEFVAGKGGYRALRDYDDFSVMPKSVLDLSRHNHIPAGKFGRVIVNGQGRLAFEQKPDQPWRFHGANGLIPQPQIIKLAGEKYADIHRLLREYVESAARAGYNMIRFNGLNDFLAPGLTAPFQVSAEYLDRMDYLLYQMKEHGIYAQISLFSYDFYVPGMDSAVRRNLNRLLFYCNDDFAWKNFMYSVQLLNHVNPYTKLAWKDDPVIAVCEFYNEQYAGLILAPHVASQFPKEYSVVEKELNAYLSKKYGADITGIKMQSGRHVPFANDIALFQEELISRTNRRGAQTLKENGYPGLFTQNNYPNLLFRNSAWQNLPWIDSHSYFHHPFRGKVDPGSAIAEGGSYFLTLAAERFADRPMSAGEFNHVFYNPYQYEGGIIFGAYSALQDWSGACIHEQPVVRDRRLVAALPRLESFSVATNPVVRASELLRWCFFRRGDVKSSPHLTAMEYRDEFCRREANGFFASNTEQSLLALLTMFCSRYPADPSYSKAPHPEVHATFKPLSGSTINAQEYFAQVTANPNAGKWIAGAVKELREKGILPPGNRTDTAKGIFQSDTGEITMDIPNKRMTVITPKSEAVASPAAQKLNLGILQNLSFSADGCAALIAMDDQPLATSKHLVMLYATRAASQGMMLTPDDQTMLMGGELPVLLKTGTISGILKGKSNLRCYALGINGERLEEILLTPTADGLTFTIDTAALKVEPSLFFELIQEDQK